jgi:hypothetical protein
MWIASGCSSVARSTAYWSSGARRIRGIAIGLGVLFVPATGAARGVCAAPNGVHHWKAVETVDGGGTGQADTSSDHPRRNANGFMVRPVSAKMSWLAGEVGAPPALARLGLGRGRQCQTPDAGAAGE